MGNRYYSWKTINWQLLPSSTEPPILVERWKIERCEKWPDTSSAGDPGPTFRCESQRIAFQRFVKKIHVEEKGCFRLGKSWYKQISITAQARHATNLYVKYYVLYKNVT